MIYIAHRINSKEELKKLPQEFGVELDLRDHGEQLIVQHDPFKDGENFEEYLGEYQHGLMILNIKSERIEHRVLDLLEKYAIKDYFFLDSSFPMVYTLSQSGEHNVAVRFSEFEGIDTVLAMKKQVNWVWVDCFTKMPLDRDKSLAIKQAGLKICLVSPELQGRDDQIEAYAKEILDASIDVDAICTKSYNIERWQSILKRA